MEAINGTNIPENVDYLFPPKAEFSKKEIIFSFLALPLGYGFVKLLTVPMIINCDPGVGTALYLLALTAYGIFFPSEHKMNKGVFAAVTILSAAFSANIAICSNLLIQSLDALFVIMLFCYSMLVRSDSRLGTAVREMLLFDLIKSVIVMPFAEIGKCPEAVKNAVGKSSAGKNIRNSIIGLLIAVPSTLTVALLLMSADNRFAEIMEKIFSTSFEKIVVNIIQFGIGLPAAFCIFGICYAASKGSCENVMDDEHCINGLSNIRFLPLGAGIVSVLPVCILYVIFFFAQAEYFISAFFSELPEGFTYSGYARRGFFELFAVTVINLIIISAFNLFCKYDGNKRPAPMKIMTSVLCLFTVMLVATAVSKMIMYIGAYGLSRLRVYTTWFMVLIALIFILTVVRQFARFNLAKISALVFAVMFAALSFCGIDHIIAEYNISRCIDGSLEDFDINMITELSAGAAGDLAKLAGSDDDYVIAEVYDYFENYSDYLAEADWRGITLEELKAASAVKSDIS
ncbi:MAG: DUF4153 domain-containing protein [Huintestinicola sp.]